RSKRDWSSDVCSSDLSFFEAKALVRHECRLNVKSQKSLLNEYNHGNRKGTRSRPFGAYAVLSLMKSSTILRALSTSALGTSTFMPPGTAYGLILPRYSSWSTHWIPLPSNTDLMKSTWTMLPE